MAYRRSDWDDWYQTVINEVHEPACSMALVFDVRSGPNVVGRIKDLTPFMGLHSSAFGNRADFLHFIDTVIEILFIHSDQLLGKSITHFHFKEYTQVPRRVLIRFTSDKLQNVLTFARVLTAHEVLDVRCFNSRTGLYACNL